MSNTPTDTYLNTELKRLQEKQANVDDIRKSQQRILELNENNRKRYSKYTQIVIVITISLFIYLAFSFLQSSFPVIPAFVVDVVTLLLLVWVAYFTFTTLMEIGRRSPTNYDEVYVPPMPNTQSANTIAPQKQKELEGRYRVSGDITSLYNVMSGRECVGEACCPGKWNRSTNLCGFTTLEGAYSEGITEKVVGERQSVEPFESRSGELMGVPL